MYGNYKTMLTYNHAQFRVVLDALEVVLFTNVLHAADEVRDLRIKSSTVQYLMMQST